MTTTRNHIAPSPSFVPRHGFTLIEMAMVLVIIGLIIGGIMVGRDLVAAATVRHFTDQIGKYDAGANTFRTKYRGLPGDMKADDATTFGFTTRSGARGHGDGSGTVEGCGGAVVLGCETALFWRDMWQGGLSPYGTLLATDIPVDGTVSGFTVDQYLPGTPFRPATYAFMYTFQGRNGYYISSMTAVASDGTPTIGAGLTPQEAHNIDDKIDDGAPDNGVVRAMSSLAAYDAGGAPSITTCVNNTLTSLGYDVATEGTAGAISCQLFIRSSL